MAFVKTTWVEEVTPTSAANMNRLEQGIDDLYNPPRVRLTRSTSAYGSGTWWEVVWDGEAYDPAGLHAANANAIVANRVGLWVVWAFVTWAQNANGRRDTDIRHYTAAGANDTSVALDQGTLGNGDANTQISLYGEWLVGTVGESFRLAVLQSAGVNVNIISAVFAARWVSG